VKWIWIYEALHKEPLSFSLCVYNFWRRERKGYNIKQNLLNSVAFNFQNQKSTFGFTVNRTVSQFCNYLSKRLSFYMYGSLMVLCYNYLIIWLDVIRSIIGGDTDEHSVIINSFWDSFLVWFVSVPIWKIVICNYTKCSERK